MEWITAAISSVAQLGSSVVTGAYNLAGIKRESETREHESDNMLTATIFGTSSNNTTTGWNDLLNYDGTSSLPIVLIIALVATVYLLKSKK